MHHSEHNGVQTGVCDVDTGLPPHILGPMTKNNFGPQNIDYNIKILSLRIILTRTGILISGKEAEDTNLYMNLQQFI